MENETSFKGGERNHTAVLSDANAREARELRAAYGMSTRELALIFHVSRSTISLLLRGITYKDAGGPIESGRKAPGTRTAKEPTRRKLTAPERARLRELLQELAEAAAGQEHVLRHLGIRGLTVAQWKVQWASLTRDIDDLTKGLK